MRINFIKKALTLVSIISISAFLIIPHTAFAQVPWTNAVLSVISGDFIRGTVITLISHLLLTVAGWWVAITASLLDISMTATLNMADVVNNTKAIGIVWRSLRDLANIALIGVMLYASIKTILGDTGRELHEIIKNIIICGLFINFSLFGSKVLIDASNLVALTFYDAIKPYNDYSISDTIMEKIKIQSFFGSGILSGDTYANMAKNIQSSVAGETSFQTKALIIGFGAVTVMVIIGFLFLGLAITMLYRFVVLLLCLAFSPLYFIARILPQTKEFRDQWYKKFTGQLISAPAFLLFLYVGLKITGEMDFGATSSIGSLFSGSGKVANLANFASGGPEAIAAFFNYGLIIIVLTASLTASSKIGGVGGELAQSWFNNFSKWGQGMVKKSLTVGYGAMYRGTAGRAASAIAESERFKDFAAKNRITGGLLLKGVKKVADPYEKRVKEVAEKKEKQATDLGFNKGAVKAIVERKDGPDGLDYVALRSRNVSADRELKQAKLLVSKINADLKEAQNDLNNASNQSDYAKAQTRITDLNSKLSAAQTDLTTQTTTAKTAEDAYEARRKEIDAEKTRRQRVFAEQAESAIDRKFGNFFAKDKDGKDRVGNNVITKFAFKYTGKFGSAEAKAAKALKKNIEKAKIDDLKEDIKDLKKEVGDLQKKQISKGGISDEEKDRLVQAQTELLDKERELEKIEN